VLKSGDSFLIDQNVEELKLGAVKVLPGTKPASLILKEGSMLIQFEKD